MSPSATPWITENWFSSPWNYLPEATGAISLPASLKVHDVTLRDGEQQAGVEFTADEKLRIAELLDGAGIHRIEAGLPAVSPSDEEAVRRIVAAGFDAEIYVFSRCMVDDVKLALDCGATGVVMEVPSSHHLTVTGLGERSGNTPTEETILALLTMYGLDTGIRTEQFTSISREVLAMAGVSQPGNRAIVGDQLFNVESGIIATWVKNVGDDLTETFPFRPELVGQAAPEIVLGKGSGADSVTVWLDRNGLSADPDSVLEILAVVKAKSLDKKGLLTNEEFLECARKVID